MSRSIERYVDELIARALDGVPSGPGAPSQVSLRRAVSDAYYASFHFLVDQVVVQLLGKSRGQRQARFVLSRGLTHTGLRDGCRKFSSGPLAGSLVAGLKTPSPLPPVPTEVREFASLFVELQRSRHDADYNWNRRFFKGGVRIHSPQHEVRDRTLPIRFTVKRRTSVVPVRACGLAGTEAALRHRRGALTSVRG